MTLTVTVVVVVGYIGIYSYSVSGTGPTVAPQCQDDHGGQCPGSRPRLTTGCCPVLPWGQCRGGSDDQCDVDLGYSCNNSVCTGSTRLQAVDVGQTVATLTWSDFIAEHPDYVHEYSVSFSDQYRDDVTSWKTFEVGREPTVTLKDLVPGTWYFVRVGIWDDPILQTVAFYSEITMFKTDEAEFCVYHRDQVRVGDSIVIDCEERCLCQSTGVFHCNVVCPSRTAEQCTDHSQAGDQCCSLVEQCTPGSCLYNGDELQDGYSWSIGCEENCTCNAGTVRCVPFCEELPPPEDCPHPALQQTTEECCGTWTCQEQAGSICKDGTGAAFLRGKCTVCSCTDDEECLSLSDCGPVVPPKTSTVCPDPTISDGTCCPQVVCNDDDTKGAGHWLQGSSPETGTLVVQVNTNGEPDIDMAVENVTLYYTQDTGGVDTVNWSEIDVTETYTSDNESNQRDATLANLRSKMVSVLKVDKDYLITITGLKPKTFYYLKLEVMSTSTATEVSIERNTVSGIIAVKTKGTKGLTFVQTAVLQALTPTATSVLLTWSVPQAIHQPGGYLRIRYTALSDGVSFHTDRININHTSFLLEPLNQSTTYRAVLMATGNNTEPDQYITDVVFHTAKDKKTPNRGVQIEILTVELFYTCAILRWKPFRRKDVGQVVLLEVFWSGQSLRNVTQHVLIQNNITQYSIQNLEEDTFYNTWLGALLEDGSHVMSNKVHFVTKHSPVPIIHPDYHRNVVIAAVVSTACILLLIVILIAIIYVIRGRLRRASYQSHTSFENKVFQIRCDKEDVSFEIRSSS